MSVTPLERKQMLGHLSTIATSDLSTLWSSVASLPGDEFAQFLVDAFPELADQYAATASTLAADWYEQSAPDLTYRATEAPLTSTDALQSSAQWALNTAAGTDALNLMSGTLQRAVFNGARETTIHNVQRESGARWARHASATACEFCRMLATRGAVYGSRESAMQAHDNCHCLAVEIRPGSRYDPAPYVSDWEREYQQARRLAGSSDPKQILAAWRQQTSRG